MAWGGFFLRGCVLAAAVSYASCNQVTTDAAGRGPQSALATVTALGGRDPALAALVAPHEGALVRASGSGGEDEATRGRIVSEGWLAAKKQRFDMLGAKLPDRADGALEVGPSRFDTLHLQITLAGAAPTPATLDAGRVVYENALPSTDRVMLAGASVLEELLVLRDASAPRAFTWNVALPAGIARVTTQDGGYRFEDARGTPKLVLAPPRAWDARGALVALHTEWDDRAHALRVQLDPTNDAPAWPVVVDPKYETSLWFDTAGRTPPARSAQAAAYDEVRHELVVFGGAGPGGLALSDTWTWNGTSWALRAPAVSPPARGFAGMAFDAARGETVLFGGGGSTVLNDTWVWDGTNWTQRMPSVAPPARSDPAFAYDSTRREIVLFGGDLGATEFDDTWTWNGTTWTAKAPSNKPPGRYMAGIADDAQRGEVVLFGGRRVVSSAGLSDTWIWNGTNWTQKTVAMPPTGRADPALSYDSVRHEIVMFGGYIPYRADETWVWNGAASTWTKRTPATSPGARSGATLAFDTARGVTVMFGGAGDTGGLADTWTWNGTNWTARTTTAPTARGLHGTAYDPVRAEVVIFGGYGSASFGDTWAWNGAASTWTQRTPTASPTSRYGQTMVFDPATSSVLLFGGASASSPTLYTNETWLWNGTTWTQRFPATAPPARIRTAIAYDAKQREVVLFGGSGLYSQLADTWVWDGTTWTQRSPATAPTARESHALAFDSARGEVLLFGGYATAELNDTWSWNGAATTWTRRVLASPPPQRAGLIMVSDTTRGQVIMFGGSNAGALLADTWAWDGSSWATRSSTRAPAARSQAGFAYDTARGESVLFGGYAGGASSALNDTWVFRTLGGMCATNADCIDTTSCVDGVCCNAASCGTCETCAGTSPGRCTPVTNREDPDSCAASNKTSCSDLGVCKAALGEIASTADACASGYLVDGVCCSTPKCGECQVCAQALKETNEAPGVCTAAKRDSDPHEDCAKTDSLTCGHDGTCDGAGRCAFYKSGTTCGDGRICSGGGECVSTSGASCDGDHTVVAPSGDRTDCGVYKCEGASCKTSCTSKKDCAGTADCTPDHVCTSFATNSGSDSGCRIGARAGSDVAGHAFAWLACCAGAACLMRARSRRGRHSR